MSSEKQPPFHLDPNVLTKKITIFIFIILSRNGFLVIAHLPGNLWLTQTTHKISQRYIHDIAYKIHAPFILFFHKNGIRSRDQCYYNPANSG